MPIQELEERVLANFFEVLLEVEELVELPFIYIPRSLQEEQGLGLILAQLPQLIQHLRTIVNLTANRVSVRKQKINARAILHNQLDHALEVIPILGKHNTLAIIHHNQQILVDQFLYQALNVLVQPLIQLQFRSLKNLQIQHLEQLQHILATPDFQVHHPIFEVVPELDIAHQLPRQGTLANARLPNDRDETPLHANQTDYFLQGFAAWDVVLHAAG